MYVHPFCGLPVGLSFADIGKRGGGRGEEGTEFSVGAPAPGCLLCNFTSKPTPPTGIQPSDLGEEMLFSRCT